MIQKTYTELKNFVTFEDRLDYLSLRGAVGQETFGFDRWINQQFYTSREWKLVRSHVIARDNGCDLGVPGFEISVFLLIHHMNPITAEDITHGEAYILDPEFLITTTRQTHNAIHYGAKPKYPTKYTPRLPGDTKLW